MTAFTKARIRLPMTLKGMGIRDLVTRSSSEYIGGVVQGISSLLDRRDKDGLLIRGRATSDKVINWLGRTSFDSDTLDPWSTLLQQNSEIARGITLAWSEIHSDYDTTLADMEVTADDGDMLRNPVTRAGFAADGKITKQSMIQIVTSKLETAKYKLLKYSVEHELQDGSSLYPKTENA